MCSLPKVKASLRTDIGMDRFAAEGHLYKPPFSASCLFKNLLSSYNFAIEAKAIETIRHRSFWPKVKQPIMKSTNYLLGTAIATAASVVAQGSGPYPAVSESSHLSTYAY